jgi:mannose-6-phosphate isomerase-like protein (cupin superfamily)
MEMLWNAMAPGQSTGTHVHNRSDELFYVIRGRGTAFVNGSDASLESGDVIFIPKGEDHRIRSSSDDPLEVVFVGDEAGLASEFREAHALFAAGKWPPTLEEVNAITEKHGTTYKSLN